MRLLLKRYDRNRVVEKSEQKSREFRKLVIGGLAGFAGVCVVQLLGVSRLDLSLTIALYSFAPSLPLLVRDLLDTQEEDRHGISINLDPRLFATSIGVTGTIAGITAIFWHYSPWIGSLFLASCFWCAWSHSSYSGSLSEEVKTRTEDRKKEIQG